LVFLVQ